MFFVYVLKSLKDNKNYIGMTDNLSRRLKQYNDGSTKSTKNRRPFEIIYFESFLTKEEAIKKEKFYKSGKGREELKKILSAVASPTGAGCYRMSF